MAIRFARVHFYQCNSKKNLTIITSDRYIDLGIKQTEAASTRVNIINNNRNNDINHKMSRLLNIDTKSNDITWKARHLMPM